jgi:cell division protein FtsB
MQEHRRRAQFPLRKRSQELPTDGGSTHVTSAVGLEETVGRLRARRSSLFTQTVIWVTGLICLAFLLGSLAQAWSNNQLKQRVQAEQQQTQHLQAYHNHLVQQASHYQDPSVIESEARQQLGYIRPGEHPVVIVSSGNSEEQGSSRSTSPPSPQGFWQEWWNIFFGN